MLYKCLIGSGRGTTRAEDAPGTPTQSHISPSILVYEDYTGATSVVYLVEEEGEHREDAEDGDHLLLLLLPQNLLHQLPESASFVRVCVSVSMCVCVCV